MSKSKWLFLLYIILTSMPLTCLQAQFDECSLKYDKYYSKKVASYVEEINELFDSDMAKVSLQVNKRISNSLKKDDYCNQVKFMCLDALSSTFMANLDSAKSTFDRAKILAKKCKCQPFANYSLTQVLYFIATNSNNKTLADSAIIENIQSAIELNDTFKIAMGYANRSVFMLQNGRYNTGLEMSNKALEIMKNQNNESFTFGILGTIMQIYGSLKNYGKIIEVGEKALKIKSEAEGINAPYVYHSVATAYLQLKNITKSKEYYLRALEISKKTKNVEAEVVSVYNIGKFYQNQNQINEALINFNEALRLSRKIKNKNKEIEVLMTLSEVYELEDKTVKAIELINETQSIIEENSIDGSRFQLAKAKVKNIIKRQYPELFRQFIIEEKSKDSLMEESQINLNLDFLEKYNSEKKELENLKLNSDLRRQKNMTYFVVFGIFVLSTFIFFLSRQRNALKNANKMLAISQKNIQLLNKELNHRVKNNLSFMKSLLEMQSRRTSNEETKTLLKESETRLNALALVHARLFADQDNSTTVDLYDYLTEITKYLTDIYKLPDRQLIIQSDYIHHKMDAEDAMRLGLIVNELITNSVKHAFGEINEPMIHIKTSKNQNGQLVLSYQDNGSSDKAKEIGKEINTSTASLGLKLIGLLREQLADKVNVQLI